MFLLKQFTEKSKTVSKTELDSETSSENESGSELEYSDLDILIKDGGKLLYQENDRIFCLAKPKNLINSAKPFSYNRNIDLKHKKILDDILQNQFSSNKQIELYGLFQGFITKSKAIYLANGHHRYYAYKDFLAKNNDYEKMKDIKVELFVFDDLEDENIEEDERVIELFKAVNTSKEFAFKDLPVHIIYECFKLLNAKYKDCIKQGDNIKKPYLNKKKFYELLKSINVHEKFTTPEKLYKKLVKINEKQSEKIIKDFFDKINSSREKQFEKAKKMNFYLGLLDNDDIIEGLE